MALDCLTSTGVITGVISEERLLRISCREGALCLDETAEEEKLEARISLCDNAEINERGDGGFVSAMILPLKRISAIRI